MLSNDLIEDDYVEKIVEVFDRIGVGVSFYNDWMFWGVFDGYFGWIIFVIFCESLINYVVCEFNDIYKVVVS